MAGRWEANNIDDATMAALARAADAPLDGTPVLPPSPARPDARPGPRAGWKADADAARQAARRNTGRSFNRRSRHFR